MPEFHAVHCCQCSTYQVQQVKKVAKFSCRLCGTRQSVKQVHAVSSKASDVRSVVMELNAKRQAADEAADAPLQALAAQEGHTVPEQDNTVTWHEYNEMDESQEEAAHAHGDADQDYTTEVPEHLPKASRRIYSDAAPGRSLKRKGYKREVLGHPDGSSGLAVEEWQIKPQNAKTHMRPLVPRESKHDVTKRQELLCMQQQEREAGKGDMSAAHTCRMPGSAAEQLPIALSVGIKGQAVPTAADLSAS